MQNFDNRKVSSDMFLSPKTNCSIMSFKSLPVVRELAMPRYCRTPMANCTGFLRILLVEKYFLSAGTGKQTDSRAANAPTQTPNMNLSENKSAKNLPKTHSQINKTIKFYNLPSRPVSFVTTTKATETSLGHFLK